MSELASRMQYCFSDRPAEVMGTMNRGKSMNIKSIRAFLKSVIVFSSTALTVILPISVQARPYPDRPGVCYFFQKDLLKLKNPCVVSTGYGAGGHYAVLTWADGVKTAIVKTNYCPKGGWIKDASVANGMEFCRFTVDNYDAQPYTRDSFQQPTTFKEEMTYDCFRVNKTGNSVCYR